MTADEKRMLEVKEALQKCIRMAAEKFADGKNEAAWEKIKYYPNGGKIVCVIYPNNNSIDINYCTACLPWSDLGLTLGSIGMDYFNIDTITFLAMCLINSYEAE